MDSILAEVRPARGNRPPSERVIEAVATTEGCDPTELRAPLYAAVDPDALDALFVDGGAEGAVSVSFTYLGHEVTVGADGTVRVDGE